MVNRKGLKALGYDSPEEIIGKTLRIEREALGYIPQGVVCGVTDDFNYTSMREESIPMIIMQRPLFLHNIMVRLNPDQPRALETFNNVWKEIFPDYPARYAFIGDVYGQIFRNELNAGKLVRIFSLLCLLIANLGLIIYMAFIIKLRTKEIGIRKVNGATAAQVIALLSREIGYLALPATLLGAGFAYLAGKSWLEQYPEKITLSPWMFLAGILFTILTIFVCVTLQSWRIATENPAKAIKSE